MYTIFEKQMKNVKTWFALTDAQIQDPASKILFNNGVVKEIAKASTIREMRRLETETRIAYISNGSIKYA